MILCILFNEQTKHFTENVKRISGKQKKIVSLYVRERRRKIKKTAHRK